MTKEQLCAVRQFAIEQATRYMSQFATAEEVIAAATIYLDFIMNGAPCSPPTE